MVRTRHSGSPEDDSPQRFISLSHERAKSLAKIGERSTSRTREAFSNDDDDDDDLDGLNIFEEKVVETRLRPRTGPRRAYNYLDADSSDDEIKIRMGRDSDKAFVERMSRSRREKEEMMEERKRHGRSPKRSSHEEEEEEVESEANVTTRRSMRRRRQIHDTLNQSFLVNGDKMEKRSSELDANNSKNDSDYDLKEQESDDDAKEQETEDNLEFSDMYSRVKRKRIRIKRNMYGMPINDSDSDSEQDDINCSNNKRRRSAVEDDEDEHGDEDKSGHVSTRNRERSLRKREPQQTVKSYSLREHKPRTDLYKAPVEEKRHKKVHGIFDVTPTKKTNNQTYHSPALRKKHMKRSAIHSSSTSSSSESESNDEKSFKRRKAKSMAKARSRMRPMNLSSDAASSSIIKDRVKSGASLADVEPMNIDKNINFNSIGGLGKHIRALKEMVVFPLLYDKVFQRFKVDPPRGVLFYGPPGTGKTLVARALANECSHGDRRVAFFMRKGADCLSKWVGESERQLRLLFDQAYKFRPSIIFFDEIDGLAPVRSSRQDQIHSSIVSTLLALMDGLDSRGEIVVIGATNRIDSLDPALRRPGRFDREFLFPLPSLEARKQIMKIHTASWNPKLNDAFIGELAEKCVGYCGADMKALCTEAAMLALRRRYPQIYISNEVLQLDESSVNVSAKDFFDAIGNIIPTSQRACDTPARALSQQVFPILQRQLTKVMDQLSDTFPSCLSKMSSLDAAATCSQVQALAEAGAVWDEFASDEDENAPSIYITPTAKGSKSKGHSYMEDSPSTSFASSTFLNFTSYASSRPATFRPRLLLTGQPGQGQTTYIAPAVIHKMEDLPVHVLDLPALYAVTAKTPEESCANVFHEAKRKSPSIIYLPYINQWWDVMGDTLRATLLTLIQDLNPSMPLLLLATSEQPYNQLDPVLRSLFSQYSGEVITMTNPTSEERRVFFKDLLMRQTCKPPPQKKQAGEILKLMEESKRSRINLCKRQRCLQPRHLVRFLKQTKVMRSTSESEMHVLPIAELDSGNQRHEVLEQNELLLNKKYDISPQVPDLKPMPESLHPMVLRPRGNFSKLNRNQSAQHNNGANGCCIFRSKRSIMERIKSKRTVCLMEAGPSGLNHINGSCIYISERCLRHFRRCQRQDEKKGYVSSSYFSMSSVFCNGNRSGENGSGSRNSLLSCGSVQMLYKKEDMKQHHSEMRNRPLPINFRDYTNIKNGRVHTLSNKKSHHQTCKSSKSLKVKYNLGLISKRTMKRETNTVQYCRRLRSRRIMKLEMESVQCSRRLKSRQFVKPRFDIPQCSLRPKIQQSMNVCQVSCNLRPGLRPFMKPEMAQVRRHLSLRSHSFIKPELDQVQYNLRPRSRQITKAKRVRCNPRQKPEPFIKPSFHRIDYNLRPRCRQIMNLGNDRAKRMLEVLPKAAPVKPRELTAEELKQLEEKEELTLMELRIFLRDVLNKLGSDRKFTIFAKPVNIEDAPDYLDIIDNPMDLSTMMSKIDLHEYSTVRTFMNDIDLICSNALEYNPSRGPMDRIIRHRACALKDTAYAIIKTELDKDFEKMCVEIQESRKRRGVKSSTIPNYYNTKPASRANQETPRSQPSIPSYLHQNRPPRSIPQPDGERFSRRVRGLNTDPVPSLEDVEKNGRQARNNNSPEKVANNTKSDVTENVPQEKTKVVNKSDEDKDGKIDHLKTPTMPNSRDSDSVKSTSSKSKSLSKKRPKCIWCKPSRKRRHLNFLKPSVSKVSEEEFSREGERTEDAEEPESTYNQTLSLDISDSLPETNDLQSPTRKSSRIQWSTGIVTRRQSLSPRVNNAGQSKTLSKDNCAESTGQICTDNNAETQLPHQETLPPQESTLIDVPDGHLTSLNKKLRDTLLQTNGPEKNSYVRRLDLDTAITDSGAGSSLESNGDSRDSTDHRLEKNSTPGINTEITDVSNNCNTLLTKHASRILNEQSQKLEVPTERLTALLARLVHRTEGYNVERLEKIYSCLSQVIYRHRHSYNRSNMVLELEEKVEGLPVLNEDLSPIMTSRESGKLLFH